MCVFSYFKVRSPITLSEIGDFDFIEIDLVKVENNKSVIREWVYYRVKNVTWHGWASQNVNKKERKNLKIGKKICINETSLSRGGHLESEGQGHRMGVKVCAVYKCLHQGIDVPDIKTAPSALSDSLAWVLHFAAFVNCGKLTTLSYIYRLK